MTGIELQGTTGAHNVYDLAIKVSRDTSGKIVGGITLGETTPQNQAVLLASHKGEFKEFPLLGVGLGDIVNDHDYGSWKRVIMEQFEADGQRVDELTIDAAGLTIEASYKNTR